jgi:hypothetical protein
MLAQWKLGHDGKAAKLCFPKGFVGLYLFTIPSSGKRLSLADVQNPNTDLTRPAREKTAQKRSRNGNELGKRLASRRLHDNDATLLSFPASRLHSASRDDLENGVAAGGGDKVGERCVGRDRKGAAENEPA